MPHRTLTPLSVVLATLVLALASYGQSNLAGQSIKWDDYTFKFTAAGNSAQVFDKDGKIVGTILNMNGELRMLPMPGADSEKLQKSFQDWKTFNARSHSGGASTTSSSGGEPPCPTSPGTYYFDGSAWKAMTAAQAERGEHGVSIKQGVRNPLDPLGGYTNITRFKDAAAPLTLGNTPKFCVFVVPQMARNVVLATVDVKKDHRELENAMRQGGKIPEKRVQPIDVTPVSDNMVQVTPKKPLESGQYVLAPMGAASQAYDFGVDTN